MTCVKVGLFKLRAIQFPENSYNSFFYLNKLDVPASLTNSGTDIITLKLNYGKEFNKAYYSSLGAFSSQVSCGFLGASPIVFQRLGLVENEDVFISVSKSNPLTVISVRPQSAEDYNILCNIPNIMESIMLYQVRIVAPKQPMAIKVGNIIVDLNVEKIKPCCDSGRLEQYTEVVVLDYLTALKVEEDQQLDNLSSYMTLNDFLYKLYKWGSQILYKDSSENSVTTVKRKSPKEMLQAALKHKLNSNLQFRVVFENAENIDVNVIYTSYGFKKTAATPCKITKASELTSISGNSPSGPDNCIECMVKMKEVATSFLSPQVFLNKATMKHLNVGIGSRVYIEEIASLQDPYNISNECDEMEIRDGKENCFKWQSLRENINQVKVMIDSWLNYRINSNILLTGPAGSGKSYFLKMVADNCMKNNLHTSLIDCKSLRGKKIENLAKLLVAKWSECAYRDPSLLILDDLDSLMYLNEEDGDNTMGAAYCKRIALLISDLWRSFSQCSQVLLMATSSSVASLGPSLASTRGPRLFSLILNIADLSTDDRIEIFESMDVKVSLDFVKETNGFRVQDLYDLTARAKLLSIMDHRSTVTEIDLKTVQKDFVPMALRGVKLKTDIPYKWSDIGGMTKVKSVLDEIFRWPSMYPSIFSSCPLKMQTGALLYGPPGCGKTLIAGALANECGMNFKSVKGPELLSKYVGASEGAVRDLFERAQQAQPCLVFFDELDSLAPRRGSDSTGVTDRVVNQLLTELDGVEGRTGVWVLGASSRPDLIDPALLRPGRLDRAIYCPVPSKEERKLILEVLSKSLVFSEEVMFNEAIDKTEGFTGADLQALFYNAHMRAIQETPEYVGDAEITVMPHHLDAALKESKPSLTEGEKRKYEQISRRFLGGKDLITQLPQKVILA